MSPTTRLKQHMHREGGDLAWMAALHLRRRGHRVCRAVSALRDLCGSA